MTRCVHKAGLDKHEPVVLYLSVVQKSSGEYAWSYFPRALLLAKGTTEILIKLKYSPIDNSTASITSYASTGFNGDVSPISSTGRKNSAYMTIHANQIIDFGVFVTISGGLNPTTIFCDPQASNDPSL
jgi:hypothetical protein